MSIIIEKLHENTVAIIPSYEPPHAFIDYVKVLLSKGVCHVVVVNDGSNEKYSDIYSALSAIDNCTVLGYEENHGKGYALKTAFAYCKENFSEDYVFVTADCDGQHLAEDVLKVAAFAAKHPHKLALGARDFSSPNVPLRSRQGNINTRRVFKYLYRISISDTQTGLRAFSYSLLDKLISINGTRFEYEMNMLIKLHKAGIGIIEYPIATIYNEKSDDVEKVSHFKTISDSVKVFSTLLKNLGWYAFSSTLSAIADVLMFFILFTFVLPHFELPGPVSVLIATVSARVFSSIINFIFNFKFVFNGQSKLAIFKYYCLWTVQLCVSYGMASVWQKVFFGHPSIFVTIFKGITDLVIAMFSYQIQNRWVFVSKKHNRLRFAGPIFHTSRRIVNLFVPKYRSYVVPDDNKPAVYVARHLNMKGPFKIAQSTTFDLHFMVLNYFTSFRSCYRQYSTYTFTARYGRRGFKKLLGKIKAFFATLYVVPLVKSTKPIPVYRGGSDSLVTFRKTLHYLEEGENVILFPDVEYTAGSDEASEIYSGFLYIDKLYYKKHGEHLDFIVLNLDDERKTITEGGTVRFTGEVPYAEESVTVASEIKSILMKSDSN